MLLDFYILHTKQSDMDEHFLWHIKVKAEILKKSELFNFNESSEAWVFRACKFESLKVKTVKLDSAPFYISSLQSHNEFDHAVSE